MNKGIPASQISEGSVYLTLLRSVSVLSADGKAGPMVPTPDALEIRNYTFEYALQNHDGNWKQAQSYKQGQEYRARPIPIQANAQGRLPPQFSFLEISPDNVILSALKKADEGDGAILRFFETTGDITKARIKLFRKIKRAVLTNMLEEEEQNLSIQDSKEMTIEMQPFEIVTVKLEFEGG